MIKAQLPAVPGLEKMFLPASIAVIGASPEARRPGGHPLVSLRDYGFGGRVYPVNPRHQEINGMRCFPNAKDLPEACDLAIVAVPAAEVPAVIEDCGRAGIPNAIVFSAGFSEAGAEGLALQHRLDVAIRDSSVRVVGPNCVGILNLKERVFSGFGAAFRNPQWKPGPVALISQSGGFAYSIMAFCQEQGIGIDYMVSTGNEVDLTALDFIEYFLEKEEIRFIAVYLEGLKDGRRLRALGQRALEVGKPIGVWKVGNTETGRKAAVSHTANLTEDYDFYIDAFREGGFIELREVYDLIDAAKAFRSKRRPAGKNVAIVTTSGGAGVLIADRCEEAGLMLPALTDKTASELSKLVPPFASLANPIDLTAALAQTEPQFTKATGLVASDPNVDLLIIRSYPGRDVSTWAAGVAGSAAELTKPVLVSLSGTPGQSADWSRTLDDAGVACYEAPTRAVSAAAMLCRFSERERVFRAKGVPVRPAPRQALPLRVVMDELDSKTVLETCGIDIPRRVFIRVDGVIPDKVGLRFPLAVKIVSSDIAHKTEVGGVRLGVGAGELPRVLGDMKEQVMRAAPDAALKGFLLEETASGLEMLVGALVNPVFGPLISVGFGGIRVELFRDVVRRYAPFGPDEARELVLGLKGAPLLQGFRGSPRADIQALSEVISKVSWIVFDHQDTIAELEINPLMVGPEGQGVCAVDAIIRLRENRCP